MTTNAERNGGSAPVPFVVTGDEMSDGTAQTAGLPRFAAFDDTNLPGGEIFFGLAVTAPHSRSGRHHHGEAITCAYVSQGMVRVRFGPDYEEVVDAEAGDFLHVPALIPHIEENPSGEESHVVFVRAPANIVVNLD
jgi:uncharacterized RmlC-like cupin family protein